MADDPKVGIDVELNNDSIKDTVQKVKTLHKELARLSIDWSAVAKKSNASVKGIQEISKVASAFSNQLRSSTSDAVKSFVELSDKLNDASAQAGALKEQYYQAGTETEKADILSELTKTIKVVDIYFYV